MPRRGHHPFLHATALALLTLALAGCPLTKPRLDTPGTGGAGTANPAPIAAPIAAPAPVTAMRAVALLDAVCGAALPNFGTIDATLRASGITTPTAGTTTLRSPTEDVSFRLQDGPGDGKTCAMAFGSTDTPDAVKTAFTALGAFRETPLGLATKYRGRPAIFIYDGPAQQIGGLQYYAVRLLSER
ncbi:MAG: hypothetical protein ACRC6I_06950 [Paracoccaceae bacterium]